jgi:SAM-dependent methyltransferase
LESSSKDYDQSKVGAVDTQKQGYVIDNSWEGEGARLAALEAAFDPATRRHLDAVGVKEGWRCLEIGAGAGSVARWLCDRVGESGHVLATDLNPILLQDLDLPNLEVRAHDILRDDLPKAAFDLVHSRLVLEHLPGREDALRKMAAAVAPGGWLVVEDFDWSSLGGCTRKGAVLIGGLFRGVVSVMKASGYDKRFARRLPVLLNGLGLVDVGAEGRAVVLLGGTESAEWARPNLDRFRRLLTEEDAPAFAPVQRVLNLVPPLRKVLADRLERVDSLLADPEFGFVAPMMMTAWGHRPG